MAGLPERMAPAVASGAPLFHRHKAEPAEFPNPICGLVRTEHASCTCQARLPYGNADKQFKCCIKAQDKLGWGTATGPRRRSIERVCRRPINSQRTRAVARRTTAVGSCVASERGLGMVSLASASEFVVLSGAQSAAPAQSSSSAKFTDIIADRALRAPVRIGSFTLRRSTCASPARVLHGNM